LKFLNQNDRQFRLHYVSGPLDLLIQWGSRVRCTYDTGLGQDISLGATAPRCYVPVPDYAGKVCRHCLRKFAKFNAYLVLLHLPPGEYNHLNYSIYCVYAANCLNKTTRKSSNNSALYPT